MPVPHDVSSELAPKDAPWEAPSLSDFTDKSWDELTDAEKTNIAGHFAWAKELPAKSYGDLKLPHHDPKTHKVVWRGVVAATARLNQTEMPAADKAKVKAHFRHHYKEFGEKSPDVLKASVSGSQSGKQANKRNLPTGLTFSASVDLKAYEADGAGEKIAKRRFEILAYTGGQLQQSIWEAPVIVDVSGIDVGNGIIPILDDHQAVKCAVVGQSETATIENGNLVLRGPMMEPDDVTDCGKSVRDILRLADQGFRWQASIGAKCLQKDFIAADNTVQVNGRTFDGPCYVARKTVIREVSFVVIGADRETRALVASEEVKTMTFNEYCSTHGFDEATLSPEQMAYMKKNWQGEKAAKDDGDGDEDKSPDDTDTEQSSAKGDKMKASESTDDLKNLGIAGDKAKADLKANLNNDLKTIHDAHIKAKADLQKELDSLIADGRTKHIAEQKRIAGIVELTASHPNLTADFTISGKVEKRNIREHAIEAGLKPEDIQATFELAVLRSERATSGPLTYSKSTPQLTEQVIEAAILQAGDCRLFDEDFYKASAQRDAIPSKFRTDIKRDINARYTDQVQQQAHDLYRGRIGLWQVLQAGAAMNGKSVPADMRDDGSIRSALKASNWEMLDIRAAGGASYASLANVLANVLNKFLLQGYLYVEMAWRDLCAIRPMKDFKPSKSVNLFGDTEFQAVGPTGELKHASLQDQAFANQVATYGRILNITRTNIINDDLNALTQTPMLMGRGSGLKLNKLFWTTFLNPGNADDGVSFWSASHSNANLSTGAGSALSSAGLTAAVLLFDKQIGPDSNPLGVDASILLVPADLDTTARELMNAQFLVYGGASAAKQPNTNIWQGRFRPVKSRYMSNSTFTGYSTTAWYLLAEPNILPVIEAAFLNGQETPTVQTAQADFDTLGISMRGFFDVGVNIQNFRGGVKSNGA